MINVSQRVVVTNSVERIVKVKVQDSVVEVREPAEPRVQVVTVGVQGPVGTVAENVLQRALQAEQSANEAKLAATEAQEMAGDTLQGLTALVDGMKQRLDYHTGAISAIEE